MMTTKQVTQDINLLLPVQEISIKGEVMQYTFARTLHAFLGSKQKFTNWFDSRVEKYDFIENEDFCVINLSRKKSKGRGGHNKIDYRISLDMAKELAMVESNEQGKLARRYFIQCEKALQTVAPQIHSELLTQWKATRDSTGKGYRPLCAALDRNRKRQGKPIPRYLFTNETNMLTSIVLGMSVHKYKTIHQITGEIRSHLTADQLAELEYLERADEMLLDSDVNDFEARRLKLIAMRNNRFEKLAA
ncbi:antA/AntB antirepressor family protein [Rodentibacter caecimuris]|nr:MULTISPECIES: antA/AntB antirepressor family protein [Pasteurellaceae]AOF52573.1 Phage antirepressor protein [Pasteurellaceae bacterium NI1060]MCR1836998.1 antA/AntB antirepressor family protein [Pasteurella caecimuris]MCU0107018.1 antA/AntB antirepressor family protein [Pasteurella caecimuris]QIA76743.1 phage antirepressor Ant [Rodentibacter heylii]TGY48973.1 phage antirepressor Ant [Pasteurella caecimuris]